MAPDNRARSRPQSAGQRFHDTLFWFVGFSLLWALLSGNAGWYIGLPFVLTASLLAAHLALQPWQLRLRHMPSFVVFFLFYSLLGAVDVARRTLRLRCRIQPGWTIYTMHTDDTRQQLLLSAIIGLLPGTLASRINGQQLHLHLLDTDAEWQATAERLEHHLMQVLPESTH